MRTDGTRWSQENTGARARHLKRTQSKVMVEDNLGLTTEMTGVPHTEGTEKRAGTEIGLIMIVPRIIDPAAITVG